MTFDMQTCAGEAKIGIFFYIRWLLFDLDIPFLSIWCKLWTFAMWGPDAGLPLPREWPMELVQMRRSCECHNTTPKTSVTKRWVACRACFLSPMLNMFFFPNIEHIVLSRRHNSDKLEMIGFFFSISIVFHEWPCLIN